MTGGAAAAVAGLVGYGAASNHEGGAYSGVAKLWQAVGVIGLIAALPGLMGLLNTRYVRAWLVARSRLPVDVSADARGELTVSRPGEAPQRMQAWSAIWTVRRLTSGKPLWFVGDLERGGAIGSDDGVHLVAVTSARRSLRPGRRPRP